MNRAAPLRIGYVVKRFPRVSETFIAQEILELERRGAVVTVFALSAGDEPAQHAWLARLRARVIVLDELPGDAWAELAALYHDPAGRARAARAVLWALEQKPDRVRRYLREAVAIARACGEIDHLHAHFANHPAIVALLAHHLTGTPFSFTAHAKDIWVNAPGPGYWRRLLRHAAFAATVSEASRRHLAAMAGTRLAGKVHRLFNGVDLEWIRPAGRARPAQPSVRFLCVARLVEKKGVDLLLDACAALAARGTGFRLTIIGAGPLGEALNQQAQRLGLGDRVMFTGAAPHETVVAAMQDADVFVLPCRIAADGDQDNLPTVLLEAMAAGLPCVSTPVGGVAEIIEDGVTGRLVPPDDPARLADCLGELAASRSSCERMGRAGRRRAEREFDRARTVARLHEWIAAAAGWHPGSGARQARGA